MRVKAQARRDKRADKHMGLSRDKRCGRGRSWSCGPCDAAWKSNFGRLTPSTRYCPRNCVC